MFKENIKSTGSLIINVFDEQGNLKQQENVKNLVVNGGLAFIAQRLIGTPPVMSHMAIGTSITTPVDTNTTLGTESARVALTSITNVTTSTSNDSIQFVASFPAGTGTGAIKEAGVFNSASGGTMLCRTAFAEVNKGALDSMTITWTVRFD